MRRSERDSNWVRLGSKERILLVRRLALYLRAGIPIVEAVGLIEDVASSRAEQLLTKTVSGDIQRGIPLSTSFAQFPRVFSPLHIQLVAVGERTGTLPNALSRLVETLMRRADLQRKMLGALAYPAVVLVGTLGISVFLIFYTFPKIVPLFRGLHAHLPFTTRALLWLSTTLSHYWVVVGAGLFVTSIGTRYVLRIRRVRTLTERMILRMPLLGLLAQRYYTSIIFRNLSVLLGSGVHLDAALVHARQSIAHLMYTEALLSLERTVLGGSTCSSGMRIFPHLFPTVAIELMAAGEATGTLSQSTGTLADLFEEELDTHIGTLMSLMEPILMIGMGLVVGFVALAIISPMYGLTQNLSTH